MSLGSGHVWRTVMLSDVIGDAEKDAATVYFLECVHCRRTRYTAAAIVTRWFNTPRRGKNYERRGFRHHHGRPLGTCSAGSHTAQRRASGEAEIRATLERFE